MTIIEDKILTVVSSPLTEDGKLPTASTPLDKMANAVVEKAIQGDVDSIRFISELQAQKAME